MSDTTSVDKNDTIEETSVFNLLFGIKFLSCNYQQNWKRHIISYLTLPYGIRCPKPQVVSSIAHKTIDNNIMN